MTYENSDKITLKNLNMYQPSTQDVRWSPNEYKVIMINLEDGIIQFKRIDDEK